MDETLLRIELDRRLSDDEWLTNAVRQGVREAIEEHIKARNPVAEWQDGQVVWLSPEEARQRLDSLNESGSAPPKADSVAAPEPNAVI